METPNQALSKLGMLTPRQDAEETGVLWVIPGAWVPWVQVPMSCWALLPLRTSLKEGDMISFRVEIGSGKAEAVNVELI
jgi:hypothetical protein